MPAHHPSAGGSRRRLAASLAAALALAIAIPWAAGLPLWWALVIFLPAHLALLWAQLSPSCAWLGPVVTEFPPRPGSREIWLTIDDGPDPAETPRVLDILDRFGARATFFVIGTKAAAHPEWVREIHRRGHQVANHSSTHPQAWFWTLLQPRLTRELDDGAAAIRTALDGSDPPPIFRSPVGMKPPGLHPLLAARGWHLIGWTARGRDGVPNPPLDAVLRRLLAGARPGAILVLHEGRGHAPALLERLLPRLQEAGLTCVIPDPASLGSPVARR